MAIAPLIIAIRAAGAAALARTSAALRAFGTRIAAAARSAAAAARTTSTYTAALGRLVAALRRVAIAARIAAMAIGGALVRALRAAGRATLELAGQLAALAARWAVMGTLALGVAVPLVPVIGNLLGLSQLLAPAIIAAGAAFATWKLATKGFMDAVKATDAEELADALKKLSPSARSAALTLRDLGAEWKFTQRAVQEKFFAGARDDFIAMSRALQHVAHTWLPKIATSFANLRHALRFVVEDAFKSGQLDRIMAGVNDFISGLLNAIPHLTRAFLDIAEVAAPSLGELGTSISGIAKRFSDWIRMLKENGTLKAWLDKGKETFRQLMDIGKEIGRVFQAIFRGADGQGFLENLKNSMKELADWANSDNGQAVIDFFSDVGSAIANVIVWISDLVDFFHDGWEAFRRDTEGLRNATTAAFAAIGAGGTALFAIIRGGVNAFAWIGDVVGRMSGLVAAVRGAVTGINAALSAIRTTVFIDVITRQFGGGSQGYAKPINGTGGGGGLKYFAHGGRVSKGRPVVVGDGGRPEMFVPDSAGKIMPRVPTGSSAPIRVMVAPGPAAAGNPIVDAVLALFRGGQLRLTVDRSNRVVPA